MPYYVYSVHVCLRAFVTLLKHYATLCYVCHIVLTTTLYMRITRSVTVRPTVHYSTLDRCRSLAAVWNGLIDSIHKDVKSITLERLNIDNNNNRRSGIRRYLHGKVTTTSDVIKPRIAAIFKRVVGVSP